MGANPKLSLITVFGLGHMRPFPGTWGSIPPVAVAGVLIAVGAGPHSMPWVYHAVLALLLVVFSWACLAQADEAEARFLKKDPSQVVADEVAGQCLPLMLLPAGALASPAVTVFTLLYCFVAFRAMDIIKPWPARQIQRVPGGWGILLDDLVAGVYAMALVQLITRLA